MKILTSVRKRPIHRGVVLPVILLVFLAACGEPQDGVEGTDQELGQLQQDADRPYGDDAASVVMVSVTDEGRLMPTLGSGRATIAVENSGEEDCVLNVERRDDLGMMGDAAGMTHQNRTGSPGAGDNTDVGAGAVDEEEGRAGYTPGQSGEGMDGETTTRDGAYQAGQNGTMGGNQRIQAGQSSAVVLDLQPGAYEITCNDEAGESGIAGTGTLGDEGLVVMVTDRAGMGTDRGAGGATVPGAGMERPGATDQETTPGEAGPNSQSELD